ncbi:MAG: hypothetical protein U0414_05405 [Polyangiaceae bacterium]
MAKYREMSPSTINELADAIAALAKGRSHVKVLKFDENVVTSTGHGGIIIELDAMAHFAGHQDLVIPSRGDGHKIDAVVSAIRRSVEAGQPPSHANLEELFTYTSRNHR